MTKKRNPVHKVQKFVARGRNAAVEQQPMRPRDERTSLNAPAVGVAPPSATQGGPPPSVYPPCYYCTDTTHVSRDSPTQQPGGSGAGEFLHAEILRVFVSFQAGAAAVRAAVAAARATTAASRDTSRASARTEDVAEAVAAAAATARATAAARAAKFRAIASRSAAERLPRTPSERVGEMR
ncbi:hypothetical protein M3Y99_00446300 [Aphelenchoides fujianensis]|nr:hypothetical protein M3Y99_00446300 [Aphelenchoides fujianensis]